MTTHKTAGWMDRRCDPRERGKLRIGSSHRLARTRKFSVLVCGLRLTMPRFVEGLQRPRKQPGRTLTELRHRRPITTRQMSYALAAVSPNDHAVGMVSE